MRTRMWLAAGLVATAGLVACSGSTTTCNGDTCEVTVKESRGGSRFELLGHTVDFEEVKKDHIVVEQGKTSKTIRVGETAVVGRVEVHVKKIDEPWAYLTVTRAG